MMSVMVFTFIVISSGFMHFTVAQTVDTHLIGHWQGSGKIIVTWCQQDTLPVDMTITPDGKVLGTIGDAQCEGIIKTNARLLRWLGNPHYVIECQLSGALVAQEGIQRQSIKLLVDYQDGQLVGDFHSSGSKWGGKEKMMLSGSHLVLTRHKQ